MQGDLPHLRLVICNLQQDCRQLLLKVHEGASNVAVALKLQAMLDFWMYIPWSIVHRNYTAFWHYVVLLGFEVWPVVIVLSYPRVDAVFLFTSRGSLPSGHDGTFADESRIWKG